MNQPENSDYSYMELLERILNLLERRGVEKKRLVIPAPQMCRAGTLRTAWCNFQVTCELINRNKAEVSKFVLTELGADGSIDSSNNLVIKRRLTSKQLESLLKKYINEFVICRTCKSMETILNREARLSFVKCLNCGAKRGLVSIDAGFHAVTRADRRIRK